MKLRLALVCPVLLWCALSGPCLLVTNAAATKPSITITNLYDGEVIHGSTVTVSVAVSNFRLVPPVLITPSKWKTIQLLRGNQGHIHYVLDSLATMVLTRDVTTRLSHTWVNVRPGRHTVIAYLATSQHAHFPGTQAAIVHITVLGGSLPTSKPTITITDPNDGAIIHGSNVTLHVAVSNFKLVPPLLISPAKWKTIPLLKGNQGHIHYVLDSVATMVLTRDVTMKLSHTWTNVAPGRHTIIAYLATSQHAPFPGARQAVTHINVVPTTPVPTGNPTIAISSPKNGAMVRGSTVTVRVTVAHFKLVPPVYLNPPLLPGNQGHIHYVLDGLSDFIATRDAATMLSHAWTDVRPGPHTITAYLADSQHAPFPHARKAVISIHVTRGATPAKPSISITKVREVISGPVVSVVVDVAVSHFKLVPPVYTNPPQLPGNQGHIHYVLDRMSNFSATRDAVTALSHPWTGVSPGMHTIYAYLATSQHQPLPHTPVAKIRINVPSMVPSAKGAVIRIGLPKTGGGTGGGEASWNPVLLLAGCLATMAGLMMLSCGLVRGCAWLGLRR